jgi:hypothetical protein
MEFNWASGRGLTRTYGSGAQAQSTDTGAQRRLNDAKSLASHDIPKLRRDTAAAAEMVVSDLDPVQYVLGGVVLHGAGKAGRQLLSVADETPAFRRLMDIMGIKAKRAIEAAEKGRAIVHKGVEGVELSKQEALGAGERILGEEVTFQLPSGRRTRSDLLTELDTGGLKVRESKNGPTAQMTPGQVEMEQTVQSPVAMSLPAVRMLRMLDLILASR